MKNRNLPRHLRASAIAECQGEFRGLDTIIPPEMDF
jgi:hypothetical protein